MGLRKGDLPLTCFTEKQKFQMSFLDQLTKLKLKRALLIGLIAAVVIFIGNYLMGRLSQADARVSIQEMRPSLRFICSALITANSTILAILLTLISFTSETERDIKPEHYRRVEWIGRLCTATFIAAVGLLIFLVLPLNNSDVELGALYKVLYYVLLGYGAVLGGFMISIVIMLYEAATAVILIAHPHRDAEAILESRSEEG